MHGFLFTSRTKHNYSIGDSIIQTVSEERDLGVIIHQSLNASTHCAKAVKSAYRALGLINRTITNKDKTTIIRLYKELVRPHLDYCVQAWRPHLQRDIDLIERVQKRALRMIGGLSHLDYVHRLREVKLTTLECRRLRGDLIETFKILRGLEGLNPEHFFDLSTVQHRGHQLKLYKSRSNLNLRKFWFSQRVVNYWNILPRKAIEASSVNIFKGHVDKFLKNVGGLYISLSKLSAPVTRTTVSSPVV